MGDRYFRRGVSKFVILASDPIGLDAEEGGEVTAAELTAGVDVSEDVFDWSGFTIENSPINTPDLVSRFTTTIPGEETAGNPSLSIYEDTSSKAFWDALERDTDLCVAFLPEGNDEDLPAELWPARVGSRSRQPNMTDAAAFVVQFAVREVPDVNAKIVA